MRQSQQGCPSLQSWKRSFRINTSAGRWVYQANGAGSADAGVAVVDGAVFAKSDAAWQRC